MDSVEQRPTEIVSHFEKSQSHLVLNLKPRCKSPVLEKQQLIQKIKSYQIKNDELQAKNQSLQNTISDLRKLLQSASLENEEYIKVIEEENAKLTEQSSRLQAGLKYSHKEGKHLQNCALFWREFVQ